jgi:hypothetical protein
LYLQKFFPLVARQTEDQSSVVPVNKKKKSVVLMPDPNFSMQLLQADELYSMFVDSVKLASGVILHSAHFIYNKTAESAVSIYRYGSEPVKYVFYKTVEIGTIILEAGVNIVYLVFAGLVLYFVSEVGPGLLETNNKRRKLN